MKDKEQNKKTYDQSAVLYHNKYKKFIRTENVKKAFAYIKIKNPKILELGCGDGREAKKILGYSNDYLGIDISQEMIKLARKYVPKGKFKVADFEKFRFPKKIDIVFALACLLYTDKKNMGIIFKKIHRALQEKGIIYLSLKLGNYGRKVKIDDLGKKVFYYYTPTDIKKLAENKYKVLEISKNVFQGQKVFEMILQKK